MNRRIINEVLTTYLPTVFILIIVYATNFFQPFFFEAVVTVNLTSLLVLTTLFISVSKSLPPTAYVKMIDIWLIFAQLIPFVEVNRCSPDTATYCYEDNIYFQVMLHTFMDCLREDQRHGTRRINHHGVTIAVDNAEAGGKLFQKTNRMKKDTTPETLQSLPRVGVDYLQLSQLAAKKGIPIVIITFSTLYWTYGLFFFYNPMHSLK